MRFSEVKMDCSGFYGFMHGLPFFIIKYKSVFKLHNKLKFHAPTHCSLVI